METDTTKTEAEEPEVKKDNITSDHKWYIVTSSSGKENKTAQLINQRVKANEMEDLITDVVVPTQEKIIIKKGKKQTIEERIFPGYILLRMVANDTTLHIIRNTEGVQGFVGMTATSKNPTALSNKEAQGILAFTEIKQSPMFDSQFSINDAVKVSDGPFKDFVGTVKEVNESKGQVTVLLSIFDRETPVQLDFLQVSKI